VRDKQDVGSRLALAFRDNFIPGDGPFYTPGAVATSASTPTSTAEPDAGTVVAVIFKNLPPGDAPLLPAISALGLEVTANASTDATAWTNATHAVVVGKRLHVSSTLTTVKQIRYLWSDNACMGWNSTTSSREADVRYRCPLYTSGGLPVLPFVLNVER
jgi:hypothetical protein